MSKYLVFNRDSFPRERPETHAPTVNFSASTGVIYFSLGACELMGLKSGDKIEFLQDPNDSLALGFRKTDSENGFKLRQKRCGQCFAAAKLVRRILLQFGRARNTTVQIGTEKKDGAYWIIKRSVCSR